MDLADYKSSSQFAIELIKGLKINQSKFKVLIVWNNTNSVEYIFNISDSSVFESIKNVDENNALTLAGSSDELYNTSSVNITKNSIGNYSIRGNANYLTDSQYSVLSASGRAYIILFFESDNTAGVQVKFNDGEYEAVESNLKNEYGFYQILIVNNSIQNLGLTIKWRENKTESYSFNLSGINY